RTPPRVSIKVARPARIPMIHSVVLFSTWLIESAASGGDAVSGSASRNWPPGGRMRRSQAGGRQLIFMGRCLLREPGPGAGGGGGPRGGRGTGPPLGRGKGRAVSGCGGGPPGGPAAPEFRFRGGEPPHNRNPVSGPFFHAGRRDKSARNPFRMASAMAFSALF